ncbi:hypothetical protein BOO69_10465 [Sulfitobacter alexandrii]|uniref:RcnB family protein n=1 Tax=Sulfitobacter alexandrii TaxID=1917485 RepID=A0A1J0WHH8_9RHOB|nr:hypothetical protein [Sulfitobacter alexandrii]APE43788.1 hypothetical protein BOO69_10465 [Sulfitobacter alexandrii]
MKALLTAVGLAGALALASPAFAAPSTPWTAATGIETDTNVTLIKDRRGKGYRRHYRQHRDMRRGHGHHDARQFGWRHGRSEHHRPYRRYGRGDRVVRYVIIDRPQRYGLTRYPRYVQNDGYVYAVDPQTNTVLALIGLVNQILR